MNEQDELERLRAENERLREANKRMRQVRMPSLLGICASGRTLFPNNKGEDAPFGGDLKNPSRCDIFRA